MGKLERYSTSFIVRHEQIEKLEKLNEHQVLTADKEAETTLGLGSFPQQALPWLWVMSDPQAVACFSTCSHEFWQLVLASVITRIYLDDSSGTYCLYIVTGTSESQPSKYSLVMWNACSDNRNFPAGCWRQLTSQAVLINGIQVK